MRVYYSESERETLLIGQEIGKQLHPPLTVLLYGELGAGKTVLTRGLAQGLGIEDPLTVRSPTFTLVNEYPCELGILYHVDLYRLDSLRDLYSIGIEEILTRRAVVIVEWAEKLLVEAENTMTVRILTQVEPNRRRLEVQEDSPQTQPIALDSGRST